MVSLLTDSCMKKRESECCSWKMFLQASGVIIFSVLFIIIGAASGISLCGDEGPSSSAVRKLCDYITVDQPAVSLCLTEHLGNWGACVDHVFEKFNMPSTITFAYPNTTVEKTHDTKTFMKSAESFVHENMKAWAALSDELNDPSTTSSRTSLKRQTRDTGCQAAVRTENEAWKDYTICHVTDKGEVAYIDASRSEPFEKRIWGLSSFAGSGYWEETCLECGYYLQASDVIPGPDSVGDANVAADTCVEVQEVTGFDTSLAFPYIEYEGVTRCFTCENSGGEWISANNKDDNLPWFQDNEVSKIGKEMQAELIKVSLDPAKYADYKTEVEQLRNSFRALSTILRAKSTSTMDDLMFAKAIAGDTKFANPKLMALVTLMQASLHVIDCSLGESTDPYGLSCAKTFMKGALDQFVEKGCGAGDLSLETCDTKQLQDTGFQFKLLTDMVTGVAIGGIGVALCLAPGSYANPSCQALLEDPFACLTS